MLTAGRRAGVVGSPVRHSLSPLLHRAAYDALGLTGWSYGRAEVPAGALARHVAGLPAGWVGLSVTMPGKEEALALADETSDAARLAGAANTLVRTTRGWAADNTDVHGLVAALQEAGAPAPRSALVVGGGATARSALLALRDLGVEQVELRVREQLRPQTAALVEQLPLVVRVGRLADAIPLERDRWEVVVGTLPGTAPAPPLAAGDGSAPVLLDVAYAPWPSPLAVAVAEVLGEPVGRVVRGTGMLLHQAARQVELMTGLPAPLAAMLAALEQDAGRGEAR